VQKLWVKNISLRVSELSVVSLDSISAVYVLTTGCKAEGGTRPLKLETRSYLLWCIPIDATYRIASATVLNPRAAGLHAQ